MSRKQFLQRLLDKVDKGQQYIRMQINQNYQPQSPLPIKRMQIFPMGQGRINLPSAYQKQQPIMLSNQLSSQSAKHHRAGSNNRNNINSETYASSPKTYYQVTSNNSQSNHRRVFILQKVKNANDKKRKQQQIKSIVDSLAKKNELKNQQLKKSQIKAIRKQISDHLDQQYKIVGQRQEHMLHCQQAKINKQERKSVQIKKPEDEMGKQWNYRNYTSYYPCVQVDNYHSNKNSSEPQSHHYSKSRTQIKASFIKSIEPINPSSRSIKSAANQTKSNSSALHIQNAIFKRKLSNNSCIAVSNPSNNSCSPTKIQPMSTINKKYQEMKQQEKHNKLSLRQEIRKTYTKKYAVPPKISAKYYIILEKQFNQGGSPLSRESHRANFKPKQKFEYNIKSHLSFNAKSSVQIASLTKIMTCIVAIDLCSRYKLDAKKEILKIGKFQANIGGTSARIKEGDLYTLEDMLYGLMLPSGNDASLAIGVWGGKVIIGQGDANMAMINLSTKQEYTKKSSTKKNKKHQYYAKFLQEMNMKAKQLNLTKTQYANTHGLINISNKSCAYDIGVLSMYAMQNQYFRRVVSTKNYSTTITNQLKIKKQSPGLSGFKNQNNSFTTSDENHVNICRLHKSGSKKSQAIIKTVEVEEEEYEYNDCQDKQQGLDSETDLKSQDTEPKEQITQEWEFVKTTREISYQNTHKLLHKSASDYIGIKTGVTTSAGPCLCSCVKTTGGREFYIVVLNCKKMLMRFKETELLRKWIYRQQGISVPNAKRYFKHRHQMTSEGSDNDDDTLNLQEPGIDQDE